MKRKFTRYPKNINSSHSTYSRLSASDKRMILDAAEGMLYQVWDNYPDSTEDEAFQITLEHVPLDIANKYEDRRCSDQLVSLMNTKTGEVYSDEIRSIVRQYVKEHYYDYVWSTEDTR